MGALSLVCGRSRLLVLSSEDLSAGVMSFLVSAFGISGM